MRRWLLVATLMVGCAAPKPIDSVAAPLIAQVTDDGDQSWVRKTIMLLWGRHPRSSRELHVLQDIVGQIGRAETVRAMAQSYEYRDQQEQVIKDALSVHRLNFAANPGCYGQFQRPQLSTDVAEHVRQHAPHGLQAKPTFTMKDLIHSALLLDDVSPIYTTHMVATLYRAIDDMHKLASIAQRKSRVQSFMADYLNRQMSCMGCHNSEFSVTQDRTFPVGGLMEKGILASSGGRDELELIRYFRRKGVRAGYYYTHDPESEDTGRIAEERAAAIHPWGWHADCGLFFAPGQERPDDVEEWDSFFIEATGDTASIWDVQKHLKAGFEALRDGGSALALDQMEVDGDVAFAWLVAMNVADRAWKAAFGSRLTIANFFPRNPAQRDTLAQLTTAFVDSDFSMIALFTAVTEHPYYNASPPGPEDDLEPFAAIFDPFVQEHLPRDDRRNHVGHAIVRVGAREQLRSLYQALEWPELPEYLIYFMSAEARLMRSVGVFLQVGDVGFSGTSFQSALSWETEFGLCSDRSALPQCPFQAILDSPASDGVEATICELCQNRAVACDWDARCCDVAWDSYCPSECETGDPDALDLTALPRPAQSTGPDFITRLIEEKTTNATLGDAVSALKDRLLANPTLDATEITLLEQAIGAGLDEPLSAESETSLRRACGVFTATPEFQLTRAPGPDAPRGTQRLIASGTTFQAQCETLAAAMFLPGQVQCGSHAVSVKLPEEDD